MYGNVARSLGIWLAPGIAIAAPGDHIRVGEVEVIAGGSAATEYRTNVYRNESNPVPAANLRLSPGISAILDGEDHALNANGDWTLRKFFFVGDGSLNSVVPTNERINSLDRFNEFSVSAGFDTFKRNVVGFSMNDSVALINRTTDADYADLPYSSQFRNALEGHVRINPGPALSFVPGGRWTYDDYLVPRIGQNSERGLNKRHAYGPTFDIRWAFFPRTSLVFRSSYVLNRWQSNAYESEGSELGDEIALPDSDHLKLWAGVDGRFTEKIFLQLMFGYGSGTYDPDSAPVVETSDEIGANVTGIRRLLIKSQIRYDITPSTERHPGSKITTGYVRDFRDSFFTNYMGINQIFAQYDGRLGELQPSLKYELRIEDYKGEVDRNDFVNRFNADLAYWFQSYASASLGGWWQQRASNVDNVEYDDFNLHLAINFRY